MKRYEPRTSHDGWTVFDSETNETLAAAPDKPSFGAADALSTLLNDLEGIGRAPGSVAAGSEC